MNQNFLRCALFAAMALGLSLPASAGELKLSMQDGRVTLIADNVPLRQILQEWGRVGQTRIINADKMNGPAMTLQLIDTPEKDALDILLRSASGYIAAPRAVILANAAVYDRVTIMATSRAPAATAANSAPPPFQRPPPMPIDDNDEPINVQMPPQPVINNGGIGSNQVVNQFPPGFVPPNMNGAQQQQQMQPMTAPRPGMVAPQPGQPGVPNPYQPTIVRPPGSGGGPGGPGGGGN